MADVTVIIPLYNGSKFIDEAVQSCLNQTLRNLDLLVVDDGSTDNSVARLQTIADARLRILSFNHQGLCGVMNQAILHCGTEYVARLDQDDVCFPNRLETQIGFLMDHPEIVAAFGLVTRISAKGRIFGHYSLNTTESYQIYDPRIHGCPTQSAMCVRRDHLIGIGGYRESLYPADDLDLALRLSECGNIVILNKVLVKYRIHSNAATLPHFREMQVKSRFAVRLWELRSEGKPEITINQFLDLEGRKPWPSMVRGILHDRGQYLFRRAGLHIGDGRHIKGLVALLIAFCCYPTNTIHRLARLFKRD